MERLVALNIVSESAVVEWVFDPSVLAAADRSVVCGAHIFSLGVMRLAVEQVLCVGGIARRD